MLSIIHNLYKKNPYVNETVRLNLHALEESKVDYQYILFNDHGEESIYDDIKEFLSNKVEYVYSDVNWGKGICSGGWIGAQKYVKGTLIQNTGQDDVFTSLFYKVSTDCLQSDEKIKLTFCNCFTTNERLIPQSIMLPIQEIVQYVTDPVLMFKFWFGVGENGRNEVTRANNNFPAPGVIYKKELHNLIGLPDLDNFLGAADFEYWARILFNGYSCKMISNPSWLYRRSEQSASVGNDDKIKQWVDKIKDKYYHLYQEKYGK